MIIVYWNLYRKTEYLFINEGSGTRRRNLAYFLMQIIWKTREIFYRDNRIIDSYCRKSEISHM
jgi:hypothetical protein